MGYALDAAGKFSEAPVPSAQMSAGYGPRHLAFHPSKPYVYVLAELTSRVVGYHLDAKQGMGKQICDVSMIPSDFDQFTKAADIHVTPDGSFLYASNRGHDSLAIFSIDQNNGMLTPVDIMTCGGSWPRAFAIDPSGKYILVANKRSNQISVNKIDYSSGRFNQVNQIETGNAPQCIRFLKT